jgi:flavin-dependent dehydrogenase
MAQGNNSLALEDGARVAVIGGGPAGSFSAYFLLSLAERVGKELHVDIYEPRDFWGSGPTGCNMCGGIVSESLVQNLALEGIDLPEKLVQRGLDAYVLHTPVGTCRIDTPLKEKRIAAVHRGGGPRGAELSRWDGFDAFLFKLAIGKGAQFFCARVNGLGRQGGKPTVSIANREPQIYDLVIGAVGVNSNEVKLFEELGINYRRPRTVKTYITELALGTEEVKRLFGSAMHVFLLDFPRLDFAALVPKGDYVTLCMLGRDIDKDLVTAFFQHPAVKPCFPAGWQPAPENCRCAPKMFFGSARRPYGDRIILVGDCGVSRLYKDGIGAAYRTAKTAARAAVFGGISASDLRTHYWPECRRMEVDNAMGRMVFNVVHLIRHFRRSCAAVLRVATREKARTDGVRPMSSVLWDTFTGSAPYRDILRRTLSPSFLGSFGMAHVAPMKAQASLADQG